MKLRICFAYLLALCISLAFNVLVTAFVFFFSSVGLPNQCSIRILFILSQSILIVWEKCFVLLLGIRWVLRHEDHSHRYSGLQNILPRGGAHPWVSLRVRVPLRPFITRRSFQKTFVYCCPRVADWDEPLFRGVCGGGFTGTFDIVGMYLSCCVYPSFLETSSARIKHPVMESIVVILPADHLPRPPSYSEAEVKMHSHHSASGPGFDPPSLSTADCCWF